MPYPRPSRSPFIVALTGGIASGKTTVANMFKDLGVPVIDTDVIARELVEPGEPALDAIIFSFGRDYLLPDGNLDREKLRKLVFSTPHAKEKLESLLHPAIRAEALKQIRVLDSPYCMLVIPLLVESSDYGWIDRVLVVDVDECIQKSRVMARDGINGDQAEAIIGLQASRQDRLTAADDVIENSGTIEDLMPKIDALHHNYLNLAERGRT